MSICSTLSWCRAGPAVSMMCSGMPSRWMLAQHVAGGTGDLGDDGGLAACEGR